MKAIRWTASLLLVLGLLLFASRPAAGQDKQDCSGPGQHYTMAEYNMYTAAANEKNPAAQIKLLDDFTGKYPTSCLLTYIYPLYYKNFFGQKSNAKAIEYCDKMLALPEGRTSPTERYEAYFIRANAFYGIQNPDPETAKAARDAAKAALKVVDQVPKPDTETDEAFKKEKTQSLLLFNGTAATACMAAKDYSCAIGSFKAVLALAPDDLLSNFHIAQAYMGVTPPQPLDALWYYARAATNKSASEQQSKSIKSYLRKVISNYQGGTVCDALTDAEMNELLQLAPNSVDRPASYKLVTSAELDAARKDMTIATLVTDLKGGGDKAKLTWTAACGLEFPDVLGKLIEINAGPDAVELKTAFVTSEAEFDAASVANLDVIIKTADQPEAAKLEKGNPVRFTGTLESYDPDPAFMLHWDKAKVNPEDLPKTAAPKKPVRKPAPKKPGN